MIQTKPTLNTSTVPEHLFDATLQYQDDMQVVVPAEGREGVLIGSGNGTVHGKTIRGTIRWSMYSGNCAYLLVKKGIEPPPEQHLCTVNPAGVIETDDGAKIWFDAKGYGLRGANALFPHQWHLTMSLRFETDDPRYRWLNTTLGMWQGEFDEREGKACYQAFVRALPHE